MKFLNDTQLVSNFKYTSIHLLARKCHFHPPYFAARNENKTLFKKVITYKIFYYHIQYIVLNNEIYCTSDKVGHALQRVPS